MAQQTLGTKVSYEGVLAELNELVSRIERDETGMDELTGAVAKAYDLVADLRSRISRTEALLAEVIAVRQAQAEPISNDAAHVSGPDKSAPDDEE